jgi:hypothetical protein
MADMPELHEYEADNDNDPQEYTEMDEQFLRDAEQQAAASEVAATAVDVLAAAEEEYVDDLENWNNGPNPEDKAAKHRAILES